MERSAQRSDDLWRVGDGDGYVQGLGKEALQAGIVGHSTGKDKPLLDTNAPDHPPHAVDNGLVQSQGH